MSKKELLSVLVDSAIRRDILLHLSDGPKTRSELGGLTAVASSQLSIAMKELEEHSLISVDKKSYSLTPWGQAMVKQLKSLLQTIDLYEQHDRFWNGKNLSYLPEELQRRIGEIGKCKITEDDTIDSDATIAELRHYIGNATYLFGVSSMYMDALVEIFSGQAGKRTHFEIAITESIYNKVIAINPDIIPYVKNALDINLYLIKDGNIPCVIATDQCLVITPFSDDGKVILHSNVVSTEKSAVRWGKDLCEYYIARARKI